MEDLHDMFADPTIKGIICAGGGYGSARYTDKIDLQLMQENPKIFWGFSDITFLHTAMGLYSNLVTFHGPMLASCVGKNHSMNCPRRCSNSCSSRWNFIIRKQISPLETVTGGVAQGELVGGNLSLLASGIGTKFEVDTKGKLLFIEDIGEEPYQCRWLFQSIADGGKIA